MSAAEDNFLSSAGPSTVGVVLCFGTITFTAAAMAARTFLLGDSRAIIAAINFSPHRKDTIVPVENSFVSVFVLLYHLTQLGLVLFLTYIVQHHPPFPHEDRASFDPDYLVFLLLLLITFSFTTVQRNDGRKQQLLKQNSRASGASTHQNYNNGDAYSTDDGASTLASGLPSIATRRSYRSTQSHRSGRSSRSGGSSGAGGGSTGGSSNGSVEEIDFQEGSKGSAFLDTLEEESAPSRSRKAESSRGSSGRRGSRGGDSGGGGGGEGLEDIHLAEEGSKTESLMSREVSLKSGGSQSRMSTRSTVNAASLDILNVHQSLEWRGLLSAAFLFYRLTDAESYHNEVNLFFNASQVGASCFVFLTGFGHAMYFYTRNNYRWGRVLRVIFRMNVAAFFLCATMEQRYIVYWVCPLHSLAFLLTFGVMKAKHVSNYSQYGLRMKLLLLAVTIFLVWDFNLGLFDLFFSPFFSRGPPSESLPNGPLWEWYYHSHMHHWAAFVGSVYAINYPITSLLLDKMETLSYSQITLAKGTIGISLLVALAVWASGPFTTPKFAFESTHAYFAFLPVLCFAYFRNITPYLRQHHLGGLKTIGKFSLEIFLFHHYFFLANHGVSMLVLVPGYPKCNVIVSAMILLLVARTVHNLTTVLCGMILPSDDENKAMRSLIAFAVCALGFYCLAFALDAMDMGGVTVVTIIILIFGVVCYQTIMEMTWVEYKNVGRQLSTEVQEEETTVAKASPPVIGMMVVLVLGITWHILSMAGATGGDIPLPRTCTEYANEGIWAPVSSCSEFQRGLDSRELSVDGYYRGCESGATMIWGWRQTRPNLKCKFHSRSTNEMQKKLAHRKIVFIGDLTVRSLYHALCRTLGDKTAGKYDATVADHADVSKGIGNIRLDYKWAPLAFDQVSKLKDIRTKGNAGQKQPDLVVMGGGALDRLHVWATDEDQESHKVAVQKLAKELEFATAPTVWCTPTTVNTPALGNDEKRNQMNEMAISEVRKMYAEMEVEESADFVLDGPSYTRGRVAESYDGFLYPGAVYDAGIQVIANACDWLLPVADNEDDMFEPPPTGTLSNPFLGLMMACFSMIGLFFFDGYFGFSYLSSLFVRRSDGRRRQQSMSILSAVMPNDLYDEAFIPYHQRLKLPTHSSRSGMLGKGGPGKKTDDHLPQTVMRDRDILSLLDNDSLLGDNGSLSRRSYTGRGR